MLYYSESNKKKIVHFHDCPSAKMIKKENQKAFGSVSYAIRNGYKLCKHCNPLEKLYEKDKEELKKFCHENVIALEYRGHELVLTTTQSKWKVVPVSRTEYALYHANEKIAKEEESDIAGYHLQEKQFSNLFALCQ